MPLLLLFFGFMSYVCLVDFFPSVLPFIDVLSLSPLARGGPLSRYHVLDLSLSLSNIFLLVAFIQYLPLVSSLVVSPSSPPPSKVFSPLPFPIVCPCSLSLLCLPAVVTPSPSFPFFFGITTLLIILPVPLLSCYAFSSCGFVFFVHGTIVLFVKQ